MPFIPPLLRPLAPLPACLFHLFAFCLVTCTDSLSLSPRPLSSLSLSLILHRFEAEIETWPRTEAIIASLLCDDAPFPRLRSTLASTFPPPLPSFFSPSRYFYALARNISTASSFYPLARKWCSFFFFFFRHGTSNRIGRKRNFKEDRRVRNLVRKEYRKKEKRDEGKSSRYSTYYFVYLRTLSFKNIYSS